ncbi:MAG: hypothetical protein ABW133_01345, partial [Polyangiaceae bacterium]
MNLWLKTAARCAVVGSIAVASAAGCSEYEPLGRRENEDAGSTKRDAPRDTSASRDVTRDVATGERADDDVIAEDVPADSRSDATNDGGATFRDVAPDSDARVPPDDAGPIVDGAMPDGAIPDSAIPDAPRDTNDGDTSITTCTTTFRFVPPAGAKPKSVQVTGEWNGFATTGTALAGPDSQGAYVGSVALAPGLVAYKVLLDGQFVLDPSARLRKYLGGVENSAVRITDCRAPTLALTSQATARPAAGQGRYQATVAFRAGQGSPAFDPATATASLRRDGSRMTLPVAIDVATSTLSVDATQLADGKYSVFIDAKDAAGRAAEALRLVFWIEADAFSWQDAVIYMAMVDRFKNGNPANDAARTPAADSRADFLGGDLEGLRAAISAGTLDKLGVNVIWLSPFHTNPQGAYLAQDGV